MIKRIRFCFAIFAALFCLSAFCVNNTSAISYVVPLNSHGAVYQDTWYCRYDIGSGDVYITSDNERSCEIPAASSGTRVGRVKMLETSNTFHVEEGKLYGFRVYVRSNFEQTSSIAWAPYVEGDNFSIINMEKVDEQTIWHKDKYCTRWNLSGTSYICVDESGSLVNYQDYYMTVFDILFRSNVTGDYKFALGSRTRSNSILLLSYGGVSMGEIFEYDLSASEKEAEQSQEDRDNLEQQSSDTESGADDSQQEAESTGTTLLSAFTSFVGALTSASPSNCRLNMDLGNLDLGNVNLCSLSPPVEFQSIASIMLILFCVPLSIATARKVINLFRSFQ